MNYIKGVHPSYKEQFDKLTTAYIEMRVNPYDACGCFVGNLLNSTKEWYFCKRTIIIQNFSERNVNDEEIQQAIASIEEESKGLYTPEEITHLEKIFMYSIRGFGGATFWRNPTPAAEEVLFKGLEKTLNVLKSIHISKGEDVEGEFAFTKRINKSLTT